MSKPNRLCNRLRYREINGLSIPPHNDRLVRTSSSNVGGGGLALRAQRNARSWDGFKQRTGAGARSAHARNKGYKRSAVELQRRRLVPNEVFELCSELVVGKPDRA